MKSSSRALYSELPQNEDLTMKLAERAGINVPKHGMIYAKDHSLIYFVQRFDRGPKKKLHTEDFGQLLGLPRDKKYNSSMEKIGRAIDQFCTFPLIEKEKLFRLALFNFLVGNEDMHVKNFSLIDKNGVTELSPAYDLVNSTLVMNAKEEIALPLNGKKSNLKKSDFIDYYGYTHLALRETAIREAMEIFHSCLPEWRSLIEISFLSEPKKQGYLDLLEKRAARLFI